MTTLASNVTSNNGADFADHLSAVNVTAVTGQLIVISMFYTEASASVFTAPTWNGQTFTQVDTTKTPSNEQIYYLKVVTGGTAPIVSTSTQYHYITDLVGVFTAAISFASTPITGYTTTLFSDTVGSYATPSYTGTSLGANDMVVGLLKATLYDSGYSVIATSFTATSPSTMAASQAFASNGLAQHYMATNTGTGSVTVAFTKSGSGNPQNRMTGFVIRENGASDTTPDAFTFTDATGAALSSVNTSNAITVAGIDAAAAISITGGTYSINGGSYTSSSGTITVGQTVTVKATASGSYSTAVNAVLTIGGVSDTYTVTTRAAGTIDSIANPVADGSTGNAITTSLLGTLTTLTIGGIASSALSATGGDGTWAVIAGDGTDTGSSTTVITPPATQSFVTLTSAPTTAGYMGAYTSITVADQFAFDTAGTLGVATNYIDVDGGIYTDLIGSQTIWKWNHTTGVMTQLTLITGVVAEPPGVASLSAIGTVVATGGATIAVLGVSSTSALGSVLAYSDSSVIASPAGVSSTSSLGIVVARGSAVGVSVQGVSSTSSVGIVTASSEGVPSDSVEIYVPADIPVTPTNRIMGNLTTGTRRSHLDLLLEDLQQRTAALMVKVESLEE